MVPVHIADMSIVFFDYMSLNGASLEQQHGFFPQHPQSAIVSTQSQERSSWIDSIFGFGPDHQQQYIRLPLANTPSSVTSSTSSFDQEGWASRVHRTHRGSSFTSTSHPQFTIPGFPLSGITQSKYLMFGSLLLSRRAVSTSIAIATTISTIS